MVYNILTRYIELYHTFILTSYLHIGDVSESARHRSEQWGTQGDCPEWRNRIPLQTGDPCTCILSLIFISLYEYDVFTVLHYTMLYRRQKTLL